MRPVKTITLTEAISGTEITIPFRAICSVTNKLFRGHIRVTYRPRRQAIEYVDLERFINDTTKPQLTAEELCYRVWAGVAAAIKPAELRVEVDVVYSQVHQPARVWKEKKSKK